MSTKKSIALEVGCIVVYTLVLIGCLIALFNGVGSGYDMSMKTGLIFGAICAIALPVANLISNISKDKEKVVVS